MNLNKRKKIQDGLKENFLSILAGMLKGEDPLNVQDSRVPVKDDDDDIYKCLYTFSESTGISHNDIIQEFYKNDPEAAQMFKDQVLENLNKSDIFEVSDDELFEQLNNWLSSEDKAVLVSDIIHDKDIF